MARDPDIGDLDEVVLRDGRVHAPRHLVLRHAVEVQLARVIDTDAGARDEPDVVGVESAVPRRVPDDGGAIAVAEHRVVRRRTVVRGAQAVLEPFQVRFSVVRIGLAGGVPWFVGCVVTPPSASTTYTTYGIYQRGYDHERIGTPKAAVKEAGQRAASRRPVHSRRRRGRLLRPAIALHGREHVQRGPDSRHTPLDERQQAGRPRRHVTSQRKSAQRASCDGWHGCQANVSDNCRQSSSQRLVVSSVAAM